MDRQIKNLLTSSANEIKQLRAANQQMSARLDMFDKMMLLFTSQPQYQSRVLGECVVYQIEKYLEANKNSE